MYQAAEMLDTLSARLKESSRALIVKHQRIIADMSARIPFALSQRLSKNRYELQAKFKELQQATSLLISNHRHRLALLQQRMDDASPQKLLARGYSITLKDGKPVKDASMLQQGDVLVSIFEK